MAVACLDASMKAGFPDCRRGSFSDRPIGVEDGCLGAFWVAHPVGPMICCLYCRDIRYLVEDTYFANFRL